MMMVQVPLLSSYYKTRVHFRAHWVPVGRQLRTS